MRTPFRPILIASVMILPGLVKGQAQEPIARVDGEEISASQLPPAVQTQIRQIRNQERTQEYEIQAKALDDLINQRLIAKEAAARGIPPDKVLAEQIATVEDPTDREVEAFYNGQRDKLNRPFEQVKAQLRQQLKQIRTDQARQTFFAKLREQHHVEVFLSPPRSVVSFDPSRVRGSGDAVTIVEFGDYQCPYCQRVQATLAELFKKYDGSLRLAFRDFPLRSVHPQAQPSAEAARCAAEQGKFWEYHDLLYQNQNSLSPATYTKLAAELSLDAGRFDACVASGRYRAQIDEDMQIGEQLGVNATPVFFINGILVSGALPAANFERVIDQELAAQSRPR